MYAWVFHSLLCPCMVLVVLLTVLWRSHLHARAVVEPFMSNGRPHSTSRSDWQLLVLGKHMQCDMFAKFCTKD